MELNQGRPWKKIFSKVCVFAFSDINSRYEAECDSTYLSFPDDMQTKNINAERAPGTSDVNDNKDTSWKEKTLFMIQQRNVGDNVIHQPEDVLGVNGGLRQQHDQFDVPPLPPRSTIIFTSSYTGLSSKGNE
ncbi:hypothetical protein JTB14_014510 [Gonioctena quinquepunctata]|nr:hypothetical protein JTB14_014510 [Gonioctena quinquepunctata]